MVSFVCRPGHLQRLLVLAAHVSTIMSVFIARNRGFSTALGLCRIASTRSRLLRSLPSSRLVYDNHDFCMLPRFHGRYFSKKTNTEVKSSLRASVDGENPEKTILRDLSDDKDTVASNASQTLEEVKPSGSGWRKRLQRRTGGVLSAAGFVISATRAMVTDHKQQWKPTVAALRSFLKATEIDLELSALLNVRLLDNIVLLSRVEKAALKGKDRRELALSGVSTIPSDEEALRYMKYATAVYGETMIRAAEMDVLGKFDERWSPSTRTRIGEHCSIPAEDIVLMDIDYGGDNNHLRHFVAVDRENEKVVLAIRGTFSISELVVDAAGFTQPFCDGEAHSEMATMAARVWEVAGATALHLLEENPNYEFILTGHSLGAGTASLLNILCHQNDRELVRGRKVRCFAYGTPPTFTPLELVPHAVNACTNYIHERDVVPFLSVDAVRHLFNCVKAIEEQTLGWTERMKLIAGYAEPDEALIDAVRAATENRLVTKPGAPVLAVPAAATVWIREKESTGRYDGKVCDSVALATLGILIDSKMLEDHFPSRYEHALHNLD